MPETHSMTPAEAPRQATDRAAAPPTLMEAIRARTRALHAEAERAGIVHELLLGRADRSGYAMLLRNLLPAYRELERGLEHHRGTPGVREISLSAVYRAAAIETDLEALCASGWQRSLILLPASEAYAAMIADAAKDEGSRLVAHAYVRYLGDLSGGRILRTLLARSMALGPHELTFYDYPGIADLDGFKNAYREALDRAAATIRDRDGVIAEAEAAFRMNIEISIAIQDLATT